MPVEIAVYSRKSRFTGKGESIENQIGLCRQYIQLHFGDNVRLHIYEDEGYSGGNTDRPMFKQMIRDAKNKVFAVLVCYRLDRISRSVGDFAELIKELEQLQIQFVSIREQFDTSSPMGRAMMYISSVFSQLERETTAERIRDNMHELAKTGRWLGGTTPTGYCSKAVAKVTVDGKTRQAYKLEIVPAEAEIVCSIFRDFLQTGSLVQVTENLKQYGAVTKNQKEFTRFAVRNILQNPVYMTADQDAYSYFRENAVEIYAEKEDFNGKFAIMAYNKTLQKHGRHPMLRNMQEWIVALGKHQGLISGTDWVRVQNILKSNCSKTYRKPKSNIALLSSLLHCAVCKSYMRPKSAGVRTKDGLIHFYYVCREKEKSKRQSCSCANADGSQLDASVCEAVLNITEDYEIFLSTLKSCCSLWKSGGNNPHKTLQSTEKAIQTLICSLQATNGSAAEPHILEQIVKLDSQVKKLRSQILQEEQNKTTVKFSNSELQTICDKLYSFPALFEEMNVAEKREILRSLINYIDWDGKTANVWMHGVFPIQVTTAASLPLREDSK